MAERIKVIILRSDRFSSCYEVVQRICSNNNKLHYFDFHKNFIRTYKHFRKSLHLALDKENMIYNGSHYSYYFPFFKMYIADYPEVEIFFVRGLRIPKEYYKQFQESFNLKFISVEFIDSDILKNYLEFVGSENLPSGRSRVELLEYHHSNRIKFFENIDQALICKINESLGEDHLLEELKKFIS